MRDVGPQSGDTYIRAVPVAAEVIPSNLDLPFTWSRNHLPGHLREGAPDIPCLHNHTVEEGVSFHRQKPEEANCYVLPQRVLYDTGSSICAISQATATALGCVVEPCDRQFGCFTGSMHPTLGVVKNLPAYIAAQTDHELKALCHWHVLPDTCGFEVLLGTPFIAHPALSSRVSHCQGLVTFYPDLAYRTPEEVARFGEGQHFSLPCHAWSPRPPGVPRRDVVLTMYAVWESSSPKPAWDVMDMQVRPPNQHPDRPPPWVITALIQDLPRVTGPNVPCLADLVYSTNTQQVHPTELAFQLLTYPALRPHLKGFWDANMSATYVKVLIQLAAVTYQLQEDCMLSMLRVHTRASRLLWAFCQTNSQLALQRSLGETALRRLQFLALEEGGQVRSVVRAVAHQVARGATNDPPEPPRPVLDELLDLLAYWPHFRGRVEGLDMRTVLNGTPRHIIGLIHQLAQWALAHGLGRACGQKIIVQYPPELPPPPSVWQEALAAPFWVNRHIPGQRTRAPIPYPPCATPETRRLSGRLQELAMAGYPVEEILERPPNLYALPSLPANQAHLSGLDIELADSDLEYWADVRTACITWGHREFGARPLAGNPESRGTETCPPTSPRA